VSFYSFGTSGLCASPGEEEERTHLNQVHVRHKSLDLPNDLRLGSRVELLELDVELSLLLWLLL